MTLVRWQATITDEAGDVQSAASVTIRDTENNIVSVWSDAAGVYLRNTNQTEETLKAWVRRYFAFAGNGATSRSAPVIEEWMNGEMFSS